MIAEAMPTHPAAMNTPDQFNLDLKDTLPPAVLAAKPGLWTSYRSFPVFSWPWLRRRTAWCVLWIMVVCLAVILGARSNKAPWPDVIEINVLIFIKLFALLCFGTIAATIARTRLHRSQQESTTLKVLGALVLGMLLGVALVYFAVDTRRAELAAKLSNLSPDVAERVARDKDDYAKHGHLVDLTTNIVIALVCGGGLAGLAFLREQRRLRELSQSRAMALLQSEKLAADSKLAVLQAQVEPHFLFNSLASVRALVKQDPDRAQSAIDALVQYLRATIPQLRAEQGREIVSTVKQQVDLAHAYLQVMAVRMGERLRVKVDVPEALAALPFPPLLLISLIENAVKHGAEPAPGVTTITILATRGAHDTLSISVIDDGAGLQPHAGHGVGLANIRAQLAARYGDAAMLSLTQNPAGGVRATITLPIPAASA
jgi:signal transduction histidine kinase